MEARFPMLDDTPEKAFPNVNRNTVQDTQVRTLSGAWQFSQGPSMLEWPQISNFIRNTFGASTPDNGFMNNAWDFSKDALWDVGVWKIGILTSATLQHQFLNFRPRSRLQTIPSHQISCNNSSRQIFQIIKVNPLLQLDYLHI
jgi:hypothetical protein